MVHRGTQIVCLPVLVCALIGGLAAAEEKAATPIPFGELKITEPVVFDKHVFPILAEKCISCHDAEGGLAEGALDLLTVAAIEKGGKKGPSIVKGKGAESLLVKLAAHQEKPFMPPKDEDPLTSEELTTLKLWVDQGAKPGEDLNPSKAYFGDNEVVLGPLPPGVHPVYALDMDASGQTLAAGRANQVFVYDVPTGGLRAQLPGHLDIVQSIAMSPDLQWLASGGYQKVLLWKIPQAVQKADLQGHAEPARATIASHDGKLAASASDDKTVRIWDVAAGKDVRKLEGHEGPVLGLAFSADDKQLATASADKKVRVFNVADGSLLATLEGHADQVLSVAFNADGKSLVTGSKDGKARIWDLATRLAPKPEAKPEEPKAEEPKAEEAKPEEAKPEEKKAEEPKPEEKAAEQPAQPEQKAEQPAAEPPKPADLVLEGHNKPVHGVAWVGDKIYSAGEDGAVRLWDAQGKQVSAIQAGEPVVALAVQPEGNWLATADPKNQVKVWTPDGKLQRTITLPKLATALAFAPGSDHLAVASEDNSVRIWATGTGQLLHTVSGHQGPVRSVNWVAAGQLISGSDDKSVRLWDVSQTWGEPKELGPFAERVLALAWSPDSKLLATGGGVPAASGEFQIWDPVLGEMVRELEDSHSDTVFGLEFSPDGKNIASVAADKFVKVYEVETGKHVKSFEGHTHHVLAVSWKADGKQLASAGADNSIKLWDFETGEQIRTVAGHNKQVTGVKWVGQTDKLISSCADRNVRLINSGNGRAERNFGGAGDFLYCVDVSTDGKTVVSGGEDGKILVWDENAKLLRTFEVPQPLQQASNTR